MPPLEFIPPHKPSVEVIKPRFVPLPRCKLSTFLENTQNDVLLT